MSLSSIPSLSRETLRNDKLLSEAARNGVFYFEIPADFNDREDAINDAINFFPLAKEIEKFTDGKFGGYHKRDNAQIESFYVERKDWQKEVLPKNIQELALKMNMLMKEILEAFLTSAGIPKELWSEATGLTTEGKGQYHFAFNHYLPEIKAEGIKRHQDFGYVSIRYIRKLGYQALYQGNWKEISPSDKHFVVVLGKAFETLVGDVSKVSGAWQRFEKISKENADFTITCDNHPEMPLKQYQTDGKLKTVHTNYQAYLEKCFKETYSPDGMPDS